MPRVNVSVHGPAPVTVIEDRSQLRLRPGGCCSTAKAEIARLTVRHHGKYTLRLDFGALSRGEVQLYDHRLGEHVPAGTRLTIALVGLLMLLLGVAGSVLLTTSIAGKRRPPRPPFVWQPGGPPHWPGQSQAPWGERRPDGSATASTSSGPPGMAF